MKTIRFGIIGCGLMGREFGSAVARWCHLPRMDVRPELVAICNRTLSPDKTGWFTTNFPTIQQVTADYKQLLANPAVDAVYAAVPHDLHRETFCAVIDAGKHLLGEKPFGMDLLQNDAILASLARHPNVFARCASQFPFAPGAQRIGEMIEAGRFGRILEVNTGFLHSSDLDTQKPINWKRRVATNGEYGVMGDLGMHVCHVVFRAGWRPRNVRAILSNIVPQRPDGKGGIAPCDTWDNATLLVEAEDPATGAPFPWTLRTQRIAPGEKNTWYLEIKGTQAAARFSTRHINQIEWLEYKQGGEQAWQTVEMGHVVAFPSITGGIFEFGFSDAILQMWAAFLHELVHGKPLRKFAGCATPQEAAMSHRLFTAALESQRMAGTVKVGG
jgi:predicted dehydrogenase